MRLSNSFCSGGTSRISRGAAVWAVIFGWPGAATLNAYDLQGSRWISTATDGAVQPGQRFTLTYSFLPDGTSIPPGLPGQLPGTSTMFSTMDANFPGGRAAWKATIASAFNQWGQFLNATFVEVTDDGAAFPTSTGALGARGDIRIGMITVPGDARGYAFFPQFGGDIVLAENQVALFSDPGPENEFRALRNTLMRYMGLALGLRDVLSADDSFLMQTQLDTSFLGPQEDDIRGIQFRYGDAFESNGSLETAVFIGGPFSTTTTAVITEENLGLGGNSDADFFAFTAFAGATLALRVDPVGTTYRFGALDPDQTQIDAKAVRNLGLRLWRRISAQNNTFELFAQIDFNGAGEGEYHPPIPYAQAGYMVAEVYSTDGVTDVQRYRLIVSNAAIDAPRPIMVVESQGEEVENGDNLNTLFPSAILGVPQTATLTIRNDGNDTLRFTGNPERVEIAGPAAADYSATLARDDLIGPGTGTATLNIDFLPTALGVRVVVVTIPNNDPDQPDFQFIVTALVSAPTEPLAVVRINDVAVEHNGAFDFGPVIVGDQTSAQLNLSNSGSETLQVSAISITGANATDFTLNLASATLSPGASATAALTFTPSAAGTRTAAVTFDNNSAQDPITVFLTGSGEIEAFEDCNLNAIPDDEEDDSDGDGLIDDCDNCPAIPNENQSDVDADGIGTACDNCPVDFNPDQIDSDGNSVGDVCEEEDDNQNNNNNNNDNNNENDNVDNDDDDDQVNGNDNNNGGAGRRPCGMGMFIMIPLMWGGLGLLRVVGRHRHWNVR